MFDNKIKIEIEEFKTIVKEIEREAKKEQEYKVQELKKGYFTLKEKHGNLEKNYIKVTQENDILKARLQELSKKQEEDRLNILSKYENLDNLLGDDE